MNKEAKIYQFENFKGWVTAGLAYNLLGGNALNADIITLEQPFRGPFLEPVSSFELPGVGKVVRIRSDGKPLPIPSGVTASGIPDARQYLEGDGPLSESFVWAANAAYWESFMDFEAVKQKGFEQSLPGGDSDGVNKRFWNDLLNKFITHTGDNLGENCPQEITAVEIGAGSGRQAYAFLATLRHLTNLRQRPEIFERVRYQIHDSAQEVIDDARVHTREFADRVSLTKNGSSIRLGKDVMLFMASNLLDNLPFDQMAYVGGAGFYNIHSRLYINRSDWYPLSSRAAGSRNAESLFGKLISARDAKDILTPNYPDATEGAVLLWQDFYNKLRFEQRGVSVSPELRVGRGVKLEDLNVEGADFMIFNVSGAVARLQSEVLRSLSPYGAAVFLDIFRRTSGFMDSNSGPTKLDGSVYGWVNLDQIEATARNSGATTAVSSFRRYNPKSNGSLVITGPEAGVQALS